MTDMKNIKIILAVLLYFYVSIVTAQTMTIPTQQRNFSTEILTVKLDSASFDKELQKIGGVILEIDPQTQIITITYPNNQRTLNSIEALKNKNFDAVLINYIEPETRAEEKPVEQWSFDPEIDKFLNIQDESIFTDRFLNEQIEQIHPRSKDYYLLIKNIHNLGTLLSEVQKMTFGQRSQARVKLAEAKELIDIINKTNDLLINYLSKMQKSFFVNLVNEYDLLNTESQ